jgi:hypothetical protein
MSDTLFLLTTTMSNDRQRIRQIKCRINQLLSELRMIEKDNHHQIPPLNISINSQLTNLSREENFCPYISSKSKQAILHSTTNQEYQAKKSKKFLFAASARATSTPKSSPIHNRLFLQPHQTSTPRRSKRHSTGLPMNNLIPLKRLMYNKSNDQHKRRHSAVPFSKRPRLHAIEENPQWI